MAQKVLILGESGTGKSASLRNFGVGDVFVINCAGKPLPFKNKFFSFTPTFENLTRNVLYAIKHTDAKAVIIDDAQYIMSFQYMRRIKENGWDKWNDIQGDFFNIIKAADDLPDDVIVYFLSHLTRDDAGREKIKTMGKMLDEKITIEGLFTTVLKTSVQDGQYYFLTQNSGLDTVKSPIGMFETYAIDNDLKYVDAKIRNFYDMGNAPTDAEIKEADKQAAAPDVTKPDADGRKRRTRKDRSAENEVKEDEKENSVEKEPQQTQVETAETESGNDEPKRRRGRPRKDNADDAGNAGNDADTNDANAGTGDDENTGLSENMTDEAAPVRRRRRRTRENAPDENKITGDESFMNIPDVPDDELPFS